MTELPIPKNFIKDLKEVIKTSGKSWRHFTAMVILVTAIVAGLFVFRMTGSAQTVGNDSVVMGAVPHTARVGDRSVVVGQTDAHGNTILNQSMAIGAGAHAGPGSIAIGSRAGAGAAPNTVEKK